MFADPPDGTVDRSDAPSGNFRDDSTAGGWLCGSLSPRCPQGAWTRLRRAGLIGEMTGALGIVAAASLLAAPLPALPPQGLVLAEAGGVTFVDLTGKRLGRMDGLRFAWEDTNVAAGLPRFPRPGRKPVAA